MCNSPPSDDPDKYIIGILNEEKAIIEEIYDTCLPTVINWVEKNSGGEADALDIFQESLLVVVRKVFADPAFRPYTPFCAYLFGIARNLWLKKLNIDKNQSEKVRNEHWEEYIGKADFEAMIERTLDGDRWLAVLDRSFKKLTPLCQKLLTAYKEGKKVPEIMELLDMKDNAVYRRKSACSESWRVIAEEDPDFKNYNPY